MDLITDGYVVLEDYMDPALLARMRSRVEELFAEEGDASGSEFRLRGFDREVSVTLRMAGEEHVGHALAAGVPDRARRSTSRQLATVRESFAAA